MNCKHGDLAIVIRSRYGNEGKIVTCINYVRINDNDCWETNPRLDPVGCVAITDDSLKPIRPDGREDEMLRITGLPCSNKLIHVRK